VPGPYKFGCLRQIPIRALHEFTGAPPTNPPALRSSESGDSAVVPTRLKPQTAMPYFHPERRLLFYPDKKRYNMKGTSSL
jgi:hypothetical protein